MIDYSHLDKISSYTDNKYEIVDIDEVFNSIYELGKKIYEDFTTKIVDILTYQLIYEDKKLLYEDNEKLLKLLYEWIKLNGFPYYIDESIGAKVSYNKLLAFSRDSLLIYLFDIIHKFCVTINNTKDEYTDDINDLNKLLQKIKLYNILDYSIKDKINKNLQKNDIKYGIELLKSLYDFSPENYSEDDIININSALIYIITSEICHRDELDAFMCQPIFSNDNMFVLDTFNSLSGIAYHKLIAKITNIRVEEIRCRNCKAWIPRKSAQHKFCDKHDCQKVREAIKQENRGKNNNIKKQKHPN